MQTYKDSAGQSYNGIIGLAKASGKHYQAVAKRLSRNKVTPELIDRIVHGKPKPPAKEVDERCKPLKIADVEYRSFEEAYHQLQPSKSRGTVRARIRSGWTLEEAFEVVPHVDGRKTAKVKPPTKSQGERFCGWEKLGREHGLPGTRVRDRVLILNWSLQKALTTPVSAPVTFLGQQYRCATAAWRAVGKNTKSQFERLRKAGHLPDVYLGHVSKPGKATHATQALIAAELGLTVGQWNYRRRKLGQTPEQAAQYVPHNGKYPVARLKNNPEIAGQEARLYVVLIIFSDGPRYKIGITTKRVGIRLRMEYQKILQRKASLLVVKQAEQEILSRLQEYLREGPSWFDGKSECFEASANVLELIKAEVNKILPSTTI